MPFRKFTDRQMVNGLATMQISGIFILIWLSVYSVRRWQSFDEVVKVNSRNIQKIEEALHQAGIRPDLVPVPDHSH